MTQEIVINSEADIQVSVPSNDFDVNYREDSGVRVEFGPPGITDRTTAFGRLLVAADDAEEARDTLGLSVITDVQPLDQELTAIAGLPSAADKVPYFTGDGTAALADFTAAGRALVDDASAAAQLTTLGVTAAAQTVLDDTTVAAMRATLGADPLRLFRCISADATGADSSTAQPWFPATGGVTLAANKTHRFEGFLHLSRSAGTTSHTTSLLFAGTAVISSIRYHAVVNGGGATMEAGLNGAGSATTAFAITGASTDAAEQVIVKISGVVRNTTGGTFIPQFKYSAAPGGAPSVKANSFFELVELGADTLTTVGTWS